MKRTQPGTTRYAAQSSGHDGIRREVASRCEDAALTNTCSWTDAARWPSTEVFASQATLPDRDSRTDRVTCHFATYLGLNDYKRIFWPGFQKAPVLFQQANGIRVTSAGRYVAEKYPQLGTIQAQGLRPVLGPSRLPPSTASTVSHA